MYGVVLFFISTLLMMARMVSFFLKRSPGICSDLGMRSSLPSSSRMRTSFFQVWYTSPVKISPTLPEYFLKTLAFSMSMMRPCRFWRMFRMPRRPKEERLSLRV